MSSIYFRYKFNAHERAEFYETLSNFTSDGLPLHDSLNEMQKSLKKQGSYLTPMLVQVVGRMQGSDGRSAMGLAEAMEAFIPSQEAALISAGERASQLAVGLDRAAHLAKSYDKLVQSVVSQLTRPIGYLLMIVALLILLSLKILPTLEKVTPRERWPIYARALGGLADSAFIIVILLAFVAAVWTSVFWYTSTRLTGETRRFLDTYLFPWRLYSKINEAVLLLTAASIIKVGLPFETAVESIQKRSSDYMRNKIAGVRSVMRGGHSAGDALATAISNRDIRWKVEVYSKTSAFARGLEGLADKGIASLIQQTERVFGILNLVVLAIVAMMIVWVLGSFFGVTMSVNASRF